MPVLPILPELANRISWPTGRSGNDGGARPPSRPVFAVTRPRKNAKGNSVSLTGSYNVWAVANIFYYVPKFKILGAGHAHSEFLSRSRQGRRRCALAHAGAVVRKYSQPPRALVPTAVSDHGSSCSCSSLTLNPTPPAAASLISSAGVTSGARQDDLLFHRMPPDESLAVVFSVRAAIVTG
jgi:hypothetical protein